MNPYAVLFWRIVTLNPYMNCYRTFAFRLIERTQVQSNIGRHKTRVVESIFERVNGTFSILAISRSKEFMGVAVASGSTSVGNRVPHAKPGVGVIATQAYTNVDYGIMGLKLMADGFSPKEALTLLLEKDGERSFRQVAIMDFKGRKAVFSGEKIPEHHAEVIRDECIAIGNMLSQVEVVSRMVENFENSRGNFGVRLLHALKAGSQSGGDKRGERSAAIIVVNTKKVIVDFKVDSSERPIDELLRQLEQR